MLLITRLELFPIETSVSSFDSFLHVAGHVTWTAKNVLSLISKFNNRSK